MGGVGQATEATDDKELKVRMGLVKYIVGVSRGHIQFTFGTQTRNMKVGISSSLIRSNYSIFQVFVCLSALLAAAAASGPLLVGGFGRPAG